MTIFERTKETSKERGLTLRQVEEKAGLGQNSIYRWKTYTPRFSNLQKVADVLGVSVDYLLGNTDEKRPAQKDDSSVQPVDLDKALSEEGMAMFDGQPLSEDYKKALLTMLQGLKGNKE